MWAVTGTTGFIGHRLLTGLNAAGVPVKALVRPEAALTAAHRRCTLVRGDVCDPEAVDMLVAGCKGLVHLASVYQNRAPSPEQMAAVNLTASERLFAAAVRAGVRRIVYLSTAGVHRHTKGITTEATPLKQAPEDPYEQHKLACEAALRQWQRGGRVETVVLRPATVYGPGDRRLQPFFDLIRRRRFFFIGRGDNAVSWVYVGDVAAAIAAAMHHPAAAGQAYLVTGPEHLTLRQLAAAVARQLKVKPPGLALPRLPFLAAAAVCERVCPLVGMAPPIYRARLRFFTDSLRYAPDKIRRDLQVALDTPLEAGLRRTLQGRPATEESSP
jgi:nucleoside-diphosphate-sugar epimerase